MPLTPAEQKKILNNSGLRAAVAGCLELCKAAETTAEALGGKAVLRLCDLDRRLIGALHEWQRGYLSEFAKAEAKLRAKLSK